MWFRVARSKMSVAAGFTTSGRFLPVPKDAQEMPKWLKNAYMPTQVQAEVGQHVIASYGAEAWRHTVKNWPTVGAPAPAGAVALLEVAFRFFLRPRWQAERRQNCPC